MVGVHRGGRNWSTIKGKMYDGVRMSNSIPEGENSHHPHWLQCTVKAPQSFLPAVVVSSRP